MTLTVAIDFNQSSSLNKALHHQPHLKSGELEKLCKETLRKSISALRLGWEGGLKSVAWPLQWRFVLWILDLGGHMSRLLGSSFQVELPVRHARGITHAELKIFFPSQHCDNDRWDLELPLGALFTSLFYSFCSTIFTETITNENMFFFFSLLLRNGKVPTDFLSHLLS